MKYLAIDNETGGIGPETTLLTSYLAVLDVNLDIIADLALTLKPDNELYVVEAGGLRVNKIDIVEHDKTARTYSDGGHVLRDFLKAHSDDGKDKLVPFGHGVQFDIIGLYKLLKRTNLEQYTSYRKMDTSSMAQFLKFSGHLPASISGSLGSLAVHFGIYAGVSHTAKDDVLTTIAVAKAMKKLVICGVANVGQFADCDHHDFWKAFDKYQDRPL